jgi:hypothetical protein
VAILMVMDLPGGTTAQYDRVLELLPFGPPPPGLLSHVCVPTDRGLMVVDVWQTQEALDAFFVTGGLGAALRDAGLTEVQPRIYAIHDDSRYASRVRSLISR